MIKDKDNQKGKWKYILKFAACWAIGIGFFVHILNVLFNGVEASIPLWFFNIFAIISAAIIIFPFGILLGILTWKTRKVF